MTVIYRKWLKVIVITKESYKVIIKNKIEKRRTEWSGDAHVDSGGVEVTEGVATSPDGEDAADTPDGGDAVVTSRGRRRHTRRRGRY